MKMKYGSFIEKKRGEIELIYPFAKWTLISIDSTYHAPYPPQMLYQGDNDQDLYKCINLHINDIGYHDECYMKLYENGKFIKNI